MRSPNASITVTGVIEQILMPGTGPVKGLAELVSEGILELQPKLLTNSEKLNDREPESV